MVAPPRKGKVPTGPGQAPKDAELVEIVESKEPWSEYVLSDGTSIKTKLVMAEVWKVDNEYDPEGNPLYVFKVNNITNTLALDHLKKKS